MESLKCLIEAQEDDCCNLKKSLQMYEREHETSNQMVNIHLFNYLFFF